MKFKQLHPWKVTPTEAIEIQEALHPRVVLKKLAGPVKTVAGIDVCCSKGSDMCWAAVVLLSFPDLEILEERWARGTIRFPYIPGLLSFREIPLLLEALMQLETGPDLILCDGQGIAHPRGLGLASHLGVLAGKASIGCAKKRLVGEFTRVGHSRGRYSFLRYQGKDVGAVLRTKTGVKPLFISPGHDITITDAIAMVLRCGGRYRIPEPLRHAHGLVTRLRGREAA